MAGLSAGFCGQAVVGGGGVAIVAAASGSGGAVVSAATGSRKDGPSLIWARVNYFYIIKR